MLYLPGFAHHSITIRSPFDQNLSKDHRTSNTEDPNTSAPNFHRKTAESCQRNLWFESPLFLNFVPEMKQKEGNEIVPFFIYQMNSTSLQEKLENMVAAM